MRRSAAAAKERIVLVRSRVEGEEVAGRGRREKKQGREEPGPVLGSPSVLFLGPDVNRQAEEGWVSGSLLNSVFCIHTQSYMFLIPGDATTASHLVLLLQLPLPPRNWQAVMATPTCISVASYCS